MGEAQRLRIRAAQCSRLARDITDPSMITALKEMALQSDQAAAYLEDAESHRTSTET
jgi:hypothetical protein